MKMAGATENELLQRISSGDRTAMRAIYERHGDGIYQFVLNWLSNPLEASDVVQETMLEVWRKAGTFGGRSSVKSWIYAIARNKAVDWTRKHGRTILTDAPPESEDDAPGPREIVSASQDAERVRACVSKLSDAHRSVIHLAFFEDLSYAEIAEIEDCPLGTVKTRVMHAKSLLLRCLSQTP